jgi:hypothetical protein
MIQQIVNETAAMLKDNPTKKMLAVGIEIHQRYTEYLDALLDSDLSQPEGVTIELDGQKTHFPTQDAFTNWLVEHIT